MSAVAETACRLQGDGSTPLQVLRLINNSTSGSTHDCMQVIAAIISGASLQGSVGAGELQTNMKCLSTLVKMCQAEDSGSFRNQEAKKGQALAVAYVHPSNFRF